MKKNCSDSTVFFKIPWCGNNTASYYCIRISPLNGIHLRKYLSKESFKIGVKYLVTLSLKEMENRGFFRLNPKPNIFIFAMYTVLAGIKNRIFKIGAQN